MEFTPTLLKKLDELATRSSTFTKEEAQDFLAKAGISDSHGYGSRHEGKATSTKAEPHSLSRKKAS